MKNLKTAISDHNYKMAGPVGFEPTVSGSGGRCIIHSATGPNKRTQTHTIKGFRGA